METIKDEELIVDKIRFIHNFTQEEGIPTNREIKVVLHEIADCLGILNDLVQKSIDNQEVKK